MPSKYKIAVLSRGNNLYSTKRLVEAGELLGHDVKIIDHTKCYCINETNKSSIFYGDYELENFDAIIPRIGSSVTGYGAAIVRQFEANNVFTTCKSIALVRSRDKLRSTQIMAKEGLPIPKTAFANHPKDIKNLIKQAGGPPLVIKLVEGTQGLGVVLAETKSASQSVIEAFYGLKANIIIQEYIAEACGSDIRAFVVGDKVVASMQRNGSSEDFRSNLHRGGSADKIVLTSAEKEIAIKATKTLGLSIAGVDMLRSKNGLLILEVNSSPGLEGIERTAQVDVASRIIKFVEKNISISKKDRVGI